MHTRSTPTEIAFFEQARRDDSTEQMELSDQLKRYTDRATAIVMDARDARKFLSDQLIALSDPGTRIDLHVGVAKLMAYGPGHKVEVICGAELIIAQRADQPLPSLIDTLLKVPRIRELPAQPEQRRFILNLMDEESLAGIRHKVWDVVVVPIEKLDERYLL